MANLNDKPCGGCLHFDRISIKSSHGRCAVRSVYPTTEQPGQSFPAGVSRAPLGTLAKPVIVNVTEIVTNCTKRREV